jgi:flagellar FliJ protein
MSNASSTKMLHDLAARHLDQAAEKLAIANKQVLEAKEKLSLLHGYRDDYIARYTYSASNGIAIQVLKNHQQFILKLDEAILGQEQQIASLNNLAKQAMLAWQVQQKKKMSYEVLLQRLKQKKYAIELKLEQKMMDEFAARAKKKVEG